MKFARFSASIQKPSEGASEKSEGLATSNQRGFMRHALLSICFSVCLTACSSGGSGEGGGGDVGDPTELTTSCGVLVNQQLESTVSTSQGVPVTIKRIFGNNEVSIQLPNAGLQLVKLSAIGTVDNSRWEAVQNALGSLARQQVYWFPAGEQCDVVSGGVPQSVVGQLVTANDQSFSEELVKRGLAPITSREPCSNPQYVSCLKAVAETEKISAGPLTSFLWKPVSDSTKKLAVHSGPANASVIVNGELGLNQGPGNGYGSLARFSRAGCGYPNAQVQVIDTATNLPYDLNGSTTFTIPDPCTRHCLIGGKIVACKK
jgi:hypothetical protein